MMRSLRNAPLCLTVAAFCLTACGTTPLFDELATNRLKVVLKGTYESNAPGPWLAIDDDGENIADDNSFDLRFTADPNLADTRPTKFMIDIAEMRLKEEKFGIERQVYSCMMDEDSDFFNGTGMGFDNDDVPSGFRYGWVSVYIRKMIFNGATIYDINNNDDLSPDSDSELFDGTGSLEKGDDPQVIFHEKDVRGFDFNLLQKLTYYDTIRLEAPAINRVFPMKVPIYGDFVYDGSEEETVLEIRFVVKNFIKKYEVKDAGNNLVLYHYYALSDWLNDVKMGDAYSDTTGNVHGGNLLAVARTYVKGKTAALTGTTAGIPGLAESDYVVAILGSDDIANYEMSFTETRPYFDPSLPLDRPVRPLYPVEDDLSAKLDYMLQLQRYKNDYDAFVDYIDDELTYENYTTAWTAYNDERRAFNIPPLVTRVVSGTFTLANVPVGSIYKLYRASSVNNAELPTGFVAINVTVDVPQSAANTTITVTP